MLLSTVCNSQSCTIVIRCLGTQNDGTEEYFYASNKFTMAEHGGTHLDAPYHFSKTGWTVDKVVGGTLHNYDTM